ncbi:MAG: hypothetical protein D6785_05225 [Planctomycetota bacterium]|nr:MAG: hypothetical protein D6785_05225 [Planctomycetota bacterium]
MKKTPLLWIMLGFILGLNGCMQAASDVKMVSVNKDKITRYCPFCNSMVSLRKKGAAKIGDPLGHFHALALPLDPEKRKEMLEKAKSWVEKANLPEIYIKAAEQGALPLEVLLKVPGKYKDWIGAPLTRLYIVGKGKNKKVMDVAYNMANVDGAVSVFCPVCKVMVLPDEHKHFQTAYDAMTKSERPYDFAKGFFWKKEEASGLGNKGVAQWCPQCKRKALLSGGHIHGLTHYCEVCQVEVFNKGHIHGLTQYCNDPKCLVDGKGVQAIYGLEKAGHVHGWSQFCPYCGTERAYEQIKLSDGTTLKGFIFDLIEVVKTPKVLSKLEEVQKSIQLYYVTYGSWPSSLEDLPDRYPSLEEGLAFEYSPQTGKVRVIRIDPSPKVLYIRGTETKLLERGFRNQRGEEGGAGSYIEKDPQDPFQLARTIYDLIIQVNYRGTMKNGKLVKHSDVKAVVGTVDSLDSSNVSYTEPDGTGNSLSGNIVLARDSELKSFDDSQIWEKVKDGGTYTVIKVIPHTIKSRNLLGDPINRNSFHDHGGRLKKIPKVSGSEVTLEDANGLTKWKFIIQEINKLQKIEKP